MNQAARSVEDGAQRMDGSLKTAGDSMSGMAELVRSRLTMVAGIVAAAFASSVEEEERLVAMHMSDGDLCAILMPLVEEWRATHGNT